MAAEGHILTSENRSFSSEINGDSVKVVATYTPEAAQIIITLDSNYGQQSISRVLTDPEIAIFRQILHDPYRKP